MTEKATMTQAQIKACRAYLEAVDLQRMSVVAMNRARLDDERLADAFSYDTFRSDAHDELLTVYGLSRGEMCEAIWDISTGMSPRDLHDALMRVKEKQIKEVLNNGFN